MNPRSKISFNTDLYPPIPPWKLIFVPNWWYGITVKQQNPRVFKRYSSPNGIDVIFKAVVMAICHFDRKFIDRVIQEVDINALSEKCQWKAYFEAGVALCDLGFAEEGIQYLEKAVQLEKFTSGPPHLSILMLCTRTKNKTAWEKRIRYALEVNKVFTGSIFFKYYLAKAYIDLAVWNKAKEVLDEIMSVDDGGRIFLADYHYSRGEYQLSSDIFDRYCLGDSLDILHPQFDYKRTVSYYKTNQTDKWKRMTKHIGYRKAWDKYYRLENLENEGVVRIPEIDQVIEAAAKQKRFIRWDKLSFVMRRLPWVLWVSFWVYRFQLLFIMAGTFFGFALLWKVIMRILHNDGGY
jgi:tetratricopeptide (TPR) repeat protein